MVSERVKQNSYNRDFRKIYLAHNKLSKRLICWKKRTVSCMLLSLNGTQKHANIPKSFADVYPEHRFEVITGNYVDLLIREQ